MSPGPSAPAPAAAPAESSTDVSDTSGRVSRATTRRRRRPAVVAVRARPDTTPAVTPALRRRRSDGDDGCYAPDVPCRRGLTGCRDEPAPAVGDRSPRLDGVRRRPVCRRTVRVRDPVARRVVERASRSTGGGALAERRAGRVRRDGGHADARTSAAGRLPLTVSGRVGLSGARACRPRRRAPPRGSASASSPRRCPACSAAPRSRARGGPVAW